MADKTDDSDGYDGRRNGNKHQHARHVKWVAVVDFFYGLDPAALKISKQARQKKPFP